MSQAKYFRRHVQFAEACINKHAKGKPFLPTLAAYFKENKKFGSRDRRSIRALTYGWFRLGYALPVASMDEQLKLAYLTLTDQTDAWLMELLEEAKLPSTFLNVTLNERLHTLEQAFNWTMDRSFPYVQHISEQIDAKEQLQHALVQPLTWVRPSNKSVAEQLADADAVVDGAYGFPVGTNFGKLDHHLEVQDLSSQQVLKQVDWSGIDTVWDCCCASGGKSLYLLDNKLVGHVIASDVRSKILDNFNQRLRRHRTKVKTTALDLSKPQEELRFENSIERLKAKHGQLEFILADVPCSGSGTWNRNPEFKYAFKEAQIEYYQTKQLAIVTNAWPFLKKGGRLLYLTCSIYAGENEGVIQNLPFEDFQIIRSGYVKGYTQKSDSMYFCEIQKNS